MNEALQALRRFAAPAAAPRCELCSAPIGDVHEQQARVGQVSQLDDVIEDGFIRF